MSEVLRYRLSRDVDLQEGETVIEPGAPTARTVPNQIGETMEWRQEHLFDGCDVVTVQWLVAQRLDHRIDQNFAASFKTLPFDFPCGIVEFKQLKDFLQIHFSVTSADQPAPQTYPGSLRRMPDHSRPSHYSWSPSNAQRTADSPSLAL
jgi:hypothetical protein